MNDIKKDYKLSKQLGKKIFLELQFDLTRDLLPSRPAYMDEYEKLEDEITLLYEKYVSKYRNMMFLDFKLEGYEKAEMDKMQVSRYWRSNFFTSHLLFHQ